MTTPTLIRNYLATAIAALVLTTSAYAINFDLVTADATLFPGNPGDSTFFHVGSTDADVAGDMAGVYSATHGGDALTGYWVRVDFNGPQPFLTSATLKAADDYLLWDAADLAAFNAGNYSSITLWNSGPGGIMNDNDRFHEISHADLYGEAGTEVPDGGLTVMLFGLGLASMAGARRIFRR